MGGDRPGRCGSTMPMTFIRPTRRLKLQGHRPAPVVGSVGEAGFGEANRRVWHMAACRIVTGTWSTVLDATSSFSRHDY